MLVFLPVLLILIFTVLTQFVGRSRIPLGTKWLILAAVVVAAWGATLALHLELPLSVVISDWLPAGGSTETLSFSLDETSWAVSIALLSMLVGIVLTDTSRLGERGSLNEWTQLLLLTSLGLVAVLANSPLAFILAWTLIDLVEIIVLVSIHPGEELPVQTIAVFGGRFLGTIFVLLATILGYQAGTPLVLSQASGTPLTLLVLGAALRLGIVPLHLPYTLDVSLRRSLGSVLRFVPPLAAFIFISRLPVITQISGWLVFVLLFSVAGVLFGAIKWFAAKNELDGRPYWLMAFSSLALIGLLNGKPDVAGYLGLVMTIVGCWVFLQAIDLKWFRYVTPIALLTMIGLPFTPAAHLPANLTEGPAGGLFFVVWIGIAFLAAGVVKFTVSVNHENDQVENWRKLFYVVGMIFLLLVPWLAELWHFSTWSDLSGLFTGIAISIILTIILVLKYSQRVRFIFSQKLTARFYKFSDRIGSMFERFFHFEWLYRLLGFIVALLERMLNSINAILEGEGGILWALVFLVLLISLITSVRGG